MNRGWIMLHRQLLENPIVAKPAYCHLWVVLLLKAAHKQTDFIWNNKRQILRPGQLVTGKNKLSEQTGIPPTTVGRILKYLKDEHQIGQQTTNKFRIITIKNWEKYQPKNKSGQQMDNKRTTDGQQMDTYNNVKNDNNDNKYSPNSDEFRLSELLFNEIVSRKPDFKRPNLQKWAVHIDRMTRLDSRAVERIEEVIRWCQQDDFWQNNILSTEKLRKHFDKLELQINKGKNNGSNKTNREFTTTSAIGKTIEA